MLDVATTETALDQVDADLLVLAVGEQDIEAGGLLDQAGARVATILRRAVADERFRAKLGQTLVVHVDGVRIARVALVGLGAAPDPSARALRVAAAARVAIAWSAASRAPAALAVQAAAEGALLGAYRFEKYVTDERGRQRTPATVLLRPPSSDDAVTPALARARSTARAVARARDLVNEPAGFLTPTRLATIAGDWAREAGVTVDVMDRAACAELGMGLFLAVAQGSNEEPRFVHLAWTPSGARRRIALVGKGITFDSGGLSLKTNEGMLDMKTDMAGAAAVLSAVVAAGEEKLPVEVHGFAACTENMPSGSSYKLGDVIRSLDGKTVEINNTDAEGRLTLADALTFALRGKPDAVLDFATLTGACVVALGPHTAGVMGNDDALAADMLAAGERAGEDMWRLPLPPRLSEQLKSEIGDMKNTGERWGGALTAGLFLKEFVGDVPWVHVDIAGPSSSSKEFGHIGKGGTGFATASILELLRRAAA